VTRTVVCLGGTGQMVLHYLLQLYLIGKITNPFRAVVMDADDVIPSVLRVKRFLDALQHAEERGRGVDGRDLPTIDLVPVRPGDAGNAYRLLTGHGRPDDGSIHASEVFFGSDTLNQDLTQGLFARPALSSVLSRDALDTHALNPENKSTTVVVGSVLGGTSGGLLARAIDQIEYLQRRHGREEVKIRAVFFGEYFRPDPDPNKISETRLQSNQRWVLRAIDESFGALHSFVIIGGPGNTNRIDRDSDAEKRGENLSWPENQANPFWRGASAVYYLLNESVKPRAGEFKKREMELPVDEVFPIKDSENRLAWSLALADALTRHRCVRRMAREPFLRAVWGEGLPNLLGYYRGLTAQWGDEVDTVTFADEVQGHLASLWSSEESLSSVFPKLPRRKRITSRRVRGVPWPKPAGKPDWSRFETPGHTASKAAASILFHALRGAQSV
jgi:hypothetical protein